MKMKISKGVQFWTEHLAGVKREGLSLMAYAGKHGLRLKTLYHWSSKLKRAGGFKSGSTDSQFVALRVSQTPRVKSEPGCVFGVRADAPGRANRVGVFMPPTSRLQKVD